MFGHEFYDSDEFVAIKKFAEIILNYREPIFYQKLKNRCGIERSISYTYDFFYNIDKNYGQYFIDRIGSGDFIIEKDKKSSLENSGSFYSDDLSRKIIYILSNESICDAFAMVHETLHDKNLDINNLSITRNMFTEYISMFGEFLFEDFMKDYLGKQVNYNNNYGFYYCFYKALNVDFQIKLIDCFINNGQITNWHFNCILKSYNLKYHNCIMYYYDMIKKNGINLQVEMRYLIGVLLSCYTSFKLKNNEFSTKDFVDINDNLNDLEPEDIYGILDLDILDNYTLMLTNESCNKLAKSYIMMINSRSR